MKTSFLNMIFIFIIIGSEKQRDGTDRVIRFLIEKKPKQWDDLQKKFDPENIYISKYKPELDAKNLRG